MNYILAVPASHTHLAILPFGLNKIIICLEVQVMPQSAHIKDDLCGSSMLFVFPFCWERLGLSNPQICPRHQPSKRSDGRHEGSGGGGGQRWQHRHSAPQGPGEKSWIML